MKQSTIEKICKVFNEGQDEYEFVIWDCDDCDEVELAIKRKVELAIKRKSDTGCQVWLVEIYYNSDSNFPLHGFLINREFGFFEALHDYKCLTDPTYADIYAPAPRGMTKEWQVGEYLHNFSEAEDKDKWLEENL